MKNYKTNDTNIETMMQEMEAQLNTLNDILDIRITEEFGLNVGIKKELLSMSSIDIDNIRNEADAQIIIENSLDGSLEERRNEALEYMSKLHESYNNDSEWSHKEFVEYIRDVFTKIKEAVDEIDEFEKEKTRIQDEAKSASKNWFEYITSPEYKEKKLKNINDMKVEMENENDPAKKRKLSKLIEQMEFSESLSFLFSRFENNPTAESMSVKDSYFDSQKSKIIMNKFIKRIVGFGYNSNIYKRFFNLEEMFLPDEYSDLNNIFLFYVMRFVSHADVYNDRDKMYVSSLLIKIYNLIYHKYDDNKYEDEFIDVIRKIDDYFMPYIDEFREKNITSPNHPIRKKRDEEYNQKIRVMLIANLQNNGIDVDTNLSTEELRKMFDDVMNKKHDSIDESNNSPNEESEVQKLTEKSINDDIIYKDRYSYYYKQNNDNNNFTYYDTDNNVVEENVPEDDVLRLMTGGNLTKETIKPI
jgi:hypothetical protein